MGITAKKIVLITSGQPSLNPRLVKEADTLIAAGYNVKVIYQYWNNWGTELDKTLLTQKKWQNIRVGGSPTASKLIYLVTQLVNKLMVFIAKKITLNFNIAEFAIGRCTWLLTYQAKKHKADLYIAHNIGALPAAVKAAKKHNTKCGFDAEDFHRNETSDDPNNFDVKLKTYIENKYYPLLGYLITASPLIAQAYQNLFSQINPKTILNVFPKTVIHKNPSTKPLKLFWFSQTIGAGRGLENIIEAITCINTHQFELHLLGNYDDAIKLKFNTLSKHKNFITYHLPIPEAAIFSFAAKFDIGLATETGTPLNRDICLTNKIFTYIQSGLAIIASNTQAQQQLMQQYPSMGMVYNHNNLAELVSILVAYAQDNELLTNHQKHAITYAQTALNWEVEQIKFLTIIKTILG